MIIGKTANYQRIIGDLPVFTVNTKSSRFKYTNRLVRVREHCTAHFFPFLNPKKLLSIIFARDNRAE